MCRLKAESSNGVFVASLLFSGLFLIAACSTPGPVEAPQSSDVTVFEGARLIVGNGDDPIEDSVFIVENDRFTAVGSSGELDLPPGAARVDLTGKTVTPAIIDTHKHLADTREGLVAQLEHFAYYGVSVATSLGRDVGQMPLDVRAATIANAARFRTAGIGISGPEPGRNEIPHWITTEDEARTAVQTEAVRNPDLVKIWVDDRGGMYEKLTPALYGAVIDEAHTHGLRVTAHIFTLEDAKGLLRAGLDAFAHGIRDQDVDEEVLALFRERPNVFLVPNLPDRGVAGVDFSWLADTLPAEEVERLQAAATDRPDAQETFGIQARNLARLHAEGVRVAFGTDGAAPWNASIEMEDMVAAGLTPADVIVAATRNSADLLQLTDVGTVETGKSADFIVLDANPLDDITNIRQIATVYLRGAEVDRAGFRARMSGQ